MINVSDVRIYGIGSIILILSIGYFVYLLYQDVVFIKKELKDYKSSSGHSYQEDDQKEDETEEEEEDYEDYFENYQNTEDLENHLDSFMVNQDLETIEEEAPLKIEEVQEVSEVDVLEEEPKKKKRGGKKKQDN